jgi:hypothetical protein
LWFCGCFEDLRADDGIDENSFIAAEFLGFEPKGEE